MVQTLIVEGNPLERKYLEILIKKEEANYRLVRSVDCVEDAEKICKTKQIDLILMDVDTAAGAYGLEALKHMKDNFFDIKMIILTAQPEYGYLERAKEMQIESFWYKTSEQIDLIDVMNRTMKGESVYPQATPVVRLGNAMSSDFSKRELDVLREVVRGALDSEISEKLHISLRTVKSHIQHLRAKTGFRNRTELAVWARGSGLIINEK